MLRRIRHWTFTVMLGLLLASLSPAYYHFLHYTTYTAPFRGVPEKFDLNALVDHTLRYYVASKPPTKVAPGDSFDSILSQIEAAAEVWNGVPSSALRVAFGGVTAPETPQSTPALDIVFDEVPPGLIAMGGPSSRAEMVSGKNGTFVPITRSVMVLNRDLSGQSSASDAFFLTLVHEMGHTLGLQHTMTSSVMSTSISRSTTKAQPLAWDDIAGLSLLYPAAGFRAATGVIRGRVVLGDAGVNLASVVALSPQGTAVSTLTNPDGTYRIEGIQPGAYYVYVHPLPPPLYGEASRANIVLPLDPDGKPIPVGPYFGTQFYPGTKSVESARALSVKAGESVDDIDFYVQPRGAPDLYAVTTYSFPGNLAVSSANIDVESGRHFLVAYGVGLAVNGAPAPGIHASVIGGSAYIPEDGVVPYAPDTHFVQINLKFNPFSGTGARHLLFSVNNDIFVLPAAFRLTQSMPPSIESVTPAADEQGRPVVAITGTNLSLASRILFDGARAKPLEIDAEGRLLVVPPPASGGHHAVVVALNPDGQSSWFLDGADPPTYDYPAAETPAFSVVPDRLTPGTEAMVEIRGANTHFTSEATRIGFGTSDVVVRDVLVLDPTLILANVAVAPVASEVTVSMTVTSGLETVTEPARFRVLPPDGNPSMHAPAVDAATGGPAYVGKTAVIHVSGLPEGIQPEALSLTFADKPVPVLGVAGDRVSFLVPADFRPVPMVARLTVNGWQAPPVLIRFHLAPPAILGVYNRNGEQVSAGTPARRGEMLQLRVADLGGAKETIDPERLRVVVNGIAHLVDQVVPAADQPGIRVVQFVLGTTVATGDAVPLTISIDGRSSQPVAIAIADATQAEAAAPSHS